MSDVLVVGAGAWGTALAAQAARAGRTVTLWARDPARAEAMERTRENPRLPGVLLPGSIRVESVLPPARDGEPAITLLAVPLQHLRDVLETIQPGGYLVCCAKGVERTTLELPAEILGDIFPGRPSGILTGPNFAHEVAAGLPAAAVVASVDPSLRETTIRALSSPGFRLYGNDDPVGAQVGGAAKNVIAIAAGAVIGARLGENARAALVTRGLAELASLATALGGQARTVAGLSGMGDLLLTCAGAASRNFSLGLALGRGEILADILAAREGVTEGVATAPALVERAARAGIPLPVCENVAALLGGRASLREAIDALMGRPLRDE